VTEDLCQRNNPEAKALEYEPLVRSFVSLLITLKLEGRISNIAESRHMKILAENLYPKYEGELA
jgi:hypothetical protein